MAGRVTLIKSVLQSIPIHCLSVLPVPKSILKAIEKIIRKFLWDNNGASRKHWIKWDSICQPICNGGLGIRPMAQIMTAMQGKLAWQYICNSSLWANHARSRFVINGKGSALWKTISPMITVLAMDCRWILGNGLTPTKFFCQNLAIPPPKRLKNKPIKEVLLSEQLKKHLILSSNPKLLDSISGDFASGFSDKIIWEKDPSGEVTAKTLMKNLFPPEVADKKFVILWQSWLPQKISIFMWKMIRDVIATQDNVMKAGIQMANKCACCKTPGFESIEHLFLHSDFAHTLFDTLCPIFGKKRASNIQHMIYDWGISANFSKFTDCLGFGILCSCLWEMWKARNHIIFEGDCRGFSRIHILRWAAYYSRTIVFSQCKDVRTNLICKSLHITPNFKAPVRIYWVPWLPYPKGSTCNFSFHIDNFSSCMSAIVRNDAGCFVAGIKISSVQKDFLKCLAQVHHELSKHGISYHCIRVSHPEILSLGREASVDWPLFTTRRSLRSLFKDKYIFRVSNSLNRPANALCRAETNYTLYKEAKDLPFHVSRFLIQDSGLLPCSIAEHRVYL